MAYIGSYFIEVFFPGFSCQEIIISPSYDLASHRRQAITLTNDDLHQWHIYATTGGGRVHLNLPCWIYCKAPSLCRKLMKRTYRKVFNIRRTKSLNWNDSHLVLKLSLPNPLKPCVKSRMKMKLEQRRQAMLQLHLSDRQINCPLRCTLY